MADIASLGIVVKTSGVKQAEQDLGRLSKEAAAAERASVNLGTSIGKYLGLGLTAVVGAGIAGIISKTIEAEKAQAQLAAVLKSTGGAAGLSAAELNKMSAGLQGLTTFDDEAITGAQSLLLTFTKIGRDVFPDATKAVLDMSQALGQDLKSSSIQLGKALQDPVKGVTALQRVGVTFSASQKEVIKDLVATGRVADAQRVILGELTKEFGGSAEAARNTLGGALKGLKNDFDNLLEGDSGSSGIKGTTAAVNQLGATMRSESVKAGFASLIQGLAFVATKAAITTSAIANLIAQVDAFGRSAGQAQYDANLAKEATLKQQIGALQAAGRTRNSLFEGQNAGKSLNALQAELAEVVKLNAAYRQAGRSKAEAATPAARTAAGVAADPNRIGPETQKLADKINAEAKAYGLAKSAVLELDRAKALSNATTEAEKKAINGAYDALIRKVKAGEGAASASKASSAASRDAAKAEREAQQATEERVRANADFTKSLEDLQAQQDGPLAQSNLAYARQQAELNALAKTGAVGADKLAQATALLAKAREKDAAKIKDELDPFDNLIQARVEELRLMGLGEAAYRTEQDLRGASIEQANKYRDALLGVNQAIVKQQEVTSALDSVRSSFAENFKDVITGAKSAKDAFKDFADSIIDNIAKIIAKRAAMALFGESGTSGGGIFGGGLGSLFGSLLGGGRAIGGPVSGNRLYEVGEGGRPETFTSGGRRYLIPGNDGQVSPAPQGGRQGPVIGALHISVPGGTTRQTATQIATQVSQALALAQRSA